MLASVIEKLGERLSEVPGLRVQGLVPAAPPDGLPVAIVALRRAAFPPPERAPIEVQVGITVVAQSITALADVVDAVIAALSHPWEADSPIRGVGTIVVQGIAPLEGHATGAFAEVVVDLFTLKI